MKQKSRKSVLINSGRVDQHKLTKSDFLYLKKNIKIFVTLPRYSEYEGIRNAEFECWLRFDRFGPFVVWK